MTVYGNVKDTAASTLNIDINGPGIGEYDQLNLQNSSPGVGGDVTLGGCNLKINLGPNFIPVLNEQFVIVYASDQVDGEIGSVVTRAIETKPLPRSNEGLYWHISYPSNKGGNPDEVVLTVVDYKGSNFKGNPGPAPILFDPATSQGLNSSEIQHVYAVVNWGDNTPDSPDYTVQNGGISFDGSTATVEGSHAYLKDGVYAVCTTFYDDGVELPTVDSLAMIVDAVPQSLIVPTGLQFTDGARDDQTVATFSLSGGFESLYDYNALINWGDGMTTAGLITYAGGEQFNISANYMHAYSNIGSDPLSVTVSDIAGDSLGPATGTVAVITPDLVGWGYHYQLTSVGSGYSYTGLVNTFVVPGVVGDPGDFQVQVRSRMVTISTIRPSSLRRHIFRGRTNSMFPLRIAPCLIPKRKTSR